MSESYEMYDGKDEMLISTMLDTNNSHEDVLDLRFHSNISVTFAFFSFCPKRDLVTLYVLGS